MRLISPPSSLSIHCTSSSSTLVMLEPRLHEINIVMHSDERQGAMAAHHPLFPSSPHAFCRAWKLLSSPAKFSFRPSIQYMQNPRECHESMLKSLFFVLHLCSHLFFVNTWRRSCYTTDSISILLLGNIFHVLLGLSTHFYPFVSQIYYY